MRAVLDVVVPVAAVISGVLLVIGLVRPATFHGRRRATLIFGPMFAVLVTAAVLLTALPHFEVTRADSEEPVVIGQSRELPVKVRNLGLTGGTFSASYGLDVIAQQDIELHLDGREEATVPLPLPSDLTRGSHEVTVGGAAFRFEALRPATYVVDLSVAPKLLKPGQRITVRAEVTNRGDVPGTFDGELRIDGKVVDAQPTEVRPGETVPLDFKVKQRSPGTRHVRLGSEQARVVVVKPVRFANGQVIERHLSSGLGRLTIGNTKNRSDAVLVLTSTSSRSPLLAVYVRARSTAVVSGIPNGKYRVYYWLGKDWNWYMHGFLTTRERCRFKDALVYTTKSWTSTWSDAYYRYSQQNTQYTTWKLTLYGVPGGTARTEDVAQGEFPRVK